MKKTLRYLSPLHRATRQIGLHLEASMAELGVSNAEGHLLSYLASYQPASVATLRRVFGLKGSTLTSMLDRLEERRLVERHPNPSDRRSLLIALTAEGRQLAGHIERPLRRLERAIDRRVTGRQREGFETVMRAIEQATGVRMPGKESS